MKTKKRTLPRWLWRMVRLLCRSKHRLHVRAAIAETYRHFAEQKAAHELAKYFEACEWASSERSRNETLRRLLARQHETATLALPGYWASDLSKDTAEALGKPTAPPL